MNSLKAKGSKLMLKLSSNRRSSEWSKEIKGATGYTISFEF
jgi:hypothetical protein